MNHKRVFVILALLITTVIISCENPEELILMSIEIIKPDSASRDTVDLSYIIMWETTDAVSDASVTLFYDTNHNPLNNLVLIESSLAATGSYLWDCSQVYEDSVWIRALVEGSGAEPIAVYSTGAITLEHSAPQYTVTVTDPPAGITETDSLYKLKWTTTGFSKPQFNVYYCTDTTLVDTISIVANLKETFEYEWDCSRIDVGYYYIYVMASQEGSKDASDFTPLTLGKEEAEADDFSDGQLLIFHGGSLPQIVVTKPPETGAEADSNYTIEWTSIVAGEDALVDLYYDTDTVPGSGLTSIVSGLDHADWSYEWNCFGVPEGTYYIYGTIHEDGSTGTDYSAGTIVIEHSFEYGFDITAPPKEGAEADEEYQIEWDTNVPEEYDLNLWFSEDTLGAELFEIEKDISNTGYYIWDCSETMNGDWYIYGEYDDEFDTMTDWSSGMLTIDHSGYLLTLTTPPVEGDSADTTFRLEWECDAPDSVLIDFSYSLNQGGSTLYPIAYDIPNSGSYNWDCSAATEGTWWIYGKITEPETAEDWSPGQLTISHGDGVNLVN
ncbi:MAG: hypothetical protein H8D05_00960 [FCB group bacterium]|nr:hypothetical protein [FCB group bacterium]